PTQPVWSPDGTQIAFIRRNLTEPRRAAPDQPPPLGDVWTLSINSGEINSGEINSGEAVQLTFTQALDRPPVWSPDGNYLAFVTADGQIGMVATDEPGTVWRMDSATIRAPLIQLAFAPVEKSK
ncbi:MAG: PD40 domain-containing protein, partial [Caldilineaceae bacterium]|nr:PD40 domain-containing protein [Caldilineaceae bacterium]